MYVSDQLVFVELHKTAGSHLGRLLQQLVPGRQVGKHNIVPHHLYNHFILGSIRNPWDWYVSLWAFGCGGQGSVRHQVSRKVNLSYYWRQLNKEMGQTWLSPGVYWAQWKADLKKPVDAWQACYMDSNDPACFRAWLKLLLNPERKYDIGEGFGFSPLSRHSGLLTYRYFKLFTDLKSSIYKEQPSNMNLADLWSAHSITNAIIRSEHLEDDLLAALKEAKIHITEDQEAYVLSQRDTPTNTSKRKDAAYYYNHECIDLVGERESFIVEQHGYKPPAINC
jgi:hypothetical protein